jgi:hypothetical protein
MGAGLLYLFAQKAFRLSPRFGLDDGEIGDWPFIPQGFGTATRGREAATAPKADSLDNHFGGASNR